MSRLFGTDGVRGIANTELTPELSFLLGRCGSIVLAGEKSHKPKILVGSDTRISCAMLESALVAGICSAGADALICGVIPTPGIAKLVKTYGCDAGVVISASHNSFEFNGIKFFNSEGFKLPDHTEDKIEDLINAENSKKQQAGKNSFNAGDRPQGGLVGHRYSYDNAAADYLKSLKEIMPLELKGYKIALDCANGATSGLAKPLFEDFGADVIAIGSEPDGLNINKDCGSTHLGKLRELVIQSKCDIGFAFDGDGDRMLAIDSNGRTIDGDILLAIISLDMKMNGKLKDDALVVTVMSNLGLDIFARENGINLVKTQVGDRYVLEKMAENGYMLGGEQSGHIIQLEHSTTGDGLLSAIRLMKIISERKAALSELSSVMHVLPQVLKGATVRNELKAAALEDPDLKTACNEMESQLNGNGRILIRASGTEPLIRVMIEGEDKDQIAAMCQTLINIINRKFAIQ
ncbi:MAG: phosphoglucosamine mutase [Saccharofermentanales bacterium]